MTRPVRHIGSGRTKVIPPNWSTDHAQVIDDTLPAAVVIRLAPVTPPAWNPSTNQTESGLGAVVYTGPARITAITSPPGGPVETVDELVFTRVYEIVLPLEVDTAVPSLLVHVTSDPDPMLTGKSLHIEHSDRGSNRFSRVLYATLAS